MKVLKKDQVQMMLQVMAVVLLFRFVLFEPLITVLGLSKPYYFAFLLAVASIMYGGVLLYKIVLQEEFPDKHIEQNTEKAYYKYLAVNVIGIGISFFVASSMGMTYYFGFFLALAAILYLYITQWRKILLFDNIVYSFIICFSFFMLVIVDLMPSLQKQEALNPMKNQLLMISLQICTLLWFLYFIKTIVMDLRFMELDIKHGRKSLATIHGRIVGAHRTTYLAILPLLLIIAFCAIHLNLPLLIGYIGICVVLPYLFYLQKLYKATTTEDFEQVNNILNIIIWLTIFSIVVLFFNLK